MSNAPKLPHLSKCPTGIRGLDEITNGGLPKGRPSLVCGNAGCGKTIVGMEFLLHGAIEYNEPGIFVSFEETADELRDNFASLGFDLADLISRDLISLDYVHVERSEIEESGEYDLDGLFIRLGYAIDTIGAKRVVLDTLEVLFAGLKDTTILRAELRRLFRWLKDSGVTAVITGERGEGMLTRYGLEEYVADCVILLDLRVVEQIATRRLRIVKYRGTTHGTDEYPFLIDESGISILPVTSLGLNHDVSVARVSSGIPRLDHMLGGVGYYRGSTILISGTAGSGKSTICANFVEAACRRGERCLYFSFEESAPQIIRNMRSIGLDLAPWVEQGLLQFHSSRPSLHGLEMHLVSIHKLIAEFKPAIVVVDPISNLAAVGSGNEAKSMLTRLVDFLKMSQITAMFSDLTHDIALESNRDEMSSLIDTWLCLRDLEHKGERNRGLHVRKSRGMAHSNQIREFLLSDKGVDLVDVYLGPDGVLTGTSRMIQESLETSNALSRQQDLQRQKREHERKRDALGASIAALRAEYENIDEALAIVAGEEILYQQALVTGRADMAHIRKADSTNRLDQAAHDSAGVAA
ncbi:MAG: kaiC [Massilia sp.]|nr:kaiC [Massilia sp.]